MLLITNYFIPLIINLIALTMLNCGVLFMAGKFIPNILENVYLNTTLTLRTIIVITICIIPANIIISNLFKNYPASTIGIASIIATIFVLTAVAILVDNIKINGAIILSFSIALLACVNLIYQLQK